MKSALICAITTCMAVLTTTPAIAQPHMQSRVNLSFNHYYSYDEIADAMHNIAFAYPELVEIRSLGKSGEGRDMWLAVVNPKSGPLDSQKPAMFIDGNIHGNEIQAAETVLYTLWYLAKAYGENDHLTELMDNYAFYLLPVENPDSRAWWFSNIASPHSPRGNQRPQDDDGDGLIDEDGPEDLDGDGSITQMWMRDPDGDWIRDRYDDRIFTRVPSGEKGEWTRLGQEGIDNDGDGRTNEDDTTADDMNRNWPADWKPNYVQGGAGFYPLSNPETRAIASFVESHPNIAGYQSYHNSGGMILRGPGASYRNDFYPGTDVRAYEKIANMGETLLPYYRSMVIYRDLYGVHGGEVNWAGESLGIISFTNELWSAGKYFQRDGNTDETKMWAWRDKLDFGQTFTPYTEIQHPEHGTVIVGGLNKWASRNTPTFMLEEEAHRNFAFTMFHAEQMPRLAIKQVDIEFLSEGLWQITVEVTNKGAIPSRTEIMSRRGIGTKDILQLRLPDGARVVMSGSISSRRDTTMNEVRFEPGRVLLDRGVPGDGRILHRFIVEAPDGTDAEITYNAEKAMNLSRKVRFEKH